MWARRLLPLASTVALALFLSAEASAEQFESETAAPDDGAFVIELDDGDVEVVPTSGTDRIRVQAVARGFGASDVAFDLQRDASDVTLRRRQAEWLRYVADGPRVRVRAWVPDSVPVRIERRGVASTPAVVPAHAVRAVSTDASLPIVRPAVNR